MTKYKVVLEITIADTDAPPTDWLVPVIESALDTFGYQAKLLNPSQVSKLQKAIQTYYPGIDLRKVPLNKEQASMIVQIGLGYRKGALKEERQTIQAKNINRQALVPNIQKGSGVRETARVEQPRRDGVSIAERQKKWSSLF